MISLVIFGAGGHARECMAIAISCGMHKRSLAYCVDDAFKTQGEISGVKVFSVTELYTQPGRPRMVIGVGAPEDRKSIAGHLAAAEFDFASLVSPAATVATSAKVGAGAVIFPGCVISTDVELGLHCHVNSLSNISHDSKVGDFTTIAPGVTICGNVNIERECWIGAGSTILNGSSSTPLRIGANAVVGGAACVTKDVPVRHLAVGVPAKVSALKGG